MANPSYMLALPRRVGGRRVSTKARHVTKKGVDVFCDTFQVFQKKRMPRITAREMFWDSHARQMNSMRAPRPRSGSYSKRNNMASINAKIHQPGGGQGCNNWL